MCTPIFRATPILLAAALMGCGDGAVVGRGLDGSAFSRSSPESIAVAGGSVVVAGPPGYCVDVQSVRDDDAYAFVLLGSCASIARDPSLRSPTTPALLTVSVSGGYVDEQGLDTEAILEFLKTEQGRAALSRSGTPATVDILEVVTEDGSVFINVRNTDPSNQGSISQDYWRSFLGIGNRLVSASVFAFSGKPLTRDAGLNVLAALSDRLRAENPLADSEEGE